MKINKAKKNFFLYVLSRDFEPSLHEYNILMISLVSKRCNYIVHCVIYDLNNLIHRTESSLMSPLISLLLYMINATLKHYFLQYPVQNWRLFMLTNCKEIIKFGSVIFPQSVCTLFRTVKK